ncbi:MAG: hypothetical protein OEW75_00140, partial [Cyclobacteriaceae bacterium]|nr:hypothetical protein [Cyclobacteriaceae bacterium]
MKVVPPSPNAAAIIEYGKVPVGYYTGAATISVPIHEINERGLSLPISVDYNATGVKVAQEASRVGLGFVLNAGGVISRTVMGQDDHNAGTVYGGYHNDIIPELAEGFDNDPNSYQYYNRQTQVNYLQGTLDTIYLDLASTSNDFQPDVYSFSFPGGSGSFILKRNKEIVFSKYTDLSIEIGEGFNYWVITDVNGTKYTFSSIEEYWDNIGGDPHKSSWYLTEIKSVNGEVFQLSYGDFGSTQYIKPLSSFVEKKLINRWESCSIQMSPPRPGIYQPVEGKLYRNKFLDSISSNNQTVYFYYGDREDLEHDIKLDSIVVKDHQKVERKSFVFSYDYFTGTGRSYYQSVIDSTMSGYLDKRLKLLSIQETGVGNEGVTVHKPYIFDYSTKSPPSKASFAQDHWGFYNENRGNISLVPSLLHLNTNSLLNYTMSLIGFERDPNPISMSIMVLEKVTYPTGGSTEFVFEPHDITYDQSDYDGRDYSTFSEMQLFYEYKTTQKNYLSSEMDTIMIDTLDLSEMLVDVDGYSTDVEASVSFRFGVPCDQVPYLDGYIELRSLDGSIVYQRVSLGTDPCVQEGDLGCLYCKTGQQYQPFTFQQNYSIPKGKYIIEMFMASTGSNYQFQEIISSYRYMVEKDINGTKNYVGGLRIKEIINKNSNGDVIGNNSYKYVKEDGISSSGLLMVRPRYGHFEEGMELVEGGLCSFSEFFMSSSPQFQLQSKNSGNHIGYSRVEEYSFPENGKKVYEYSNFVDYVFGAERASFLMSYALPVTPPPNSTVSHSLNGKLLKEISFKWDGEDYVKIYEIENQYQSIKTKEMYGLDLRTPILMSGAWAFNYEIYPYRSQIQFRTNLTKTYSRTYDYLGIDTLINEKAQQFYYDGNHDFLTRQDVWDSQGQLTSTGYTYPKDITAPAAEVGQLLAKNMVSQPLETIVSNMDGTLSASVNGYLYDPVLDHVYLKNTHYLEEPSPVNDYVKTFDGTPNDSRLKEKVNIRQDANKNIIEINKEGNQVSAFLWGYDYSRPIMMVVGMGYDQLLSLAGGQATLDLVQTYDNAQLGTWLGNLQTTLHNTGGCQATYYLYDLYLGMTSQTDPNGRATTYE